LQLAALRALARRCHRARESEGIMTGAAIPTTCPYCGIGCGVLARPRSDGAVEIAGDPEHPANFGRLCSKGAALGETLSLHDRLLHPLLQGERASWDAALDLVARSFAETIAAHGPNSVAFYVSGQLLTEDYYVANKLMKGFIGTANIDTNSRLCMASAVAGHKRAFGSDTVPGIYEDLELADLVVLAGSNLAWCHPVLYQRIAAAKEQRGSTRASKVVVIDPRATATCAIADLHLAIQPGADVALFNGLLAHLAQSGRIDRAYVERHTSGLAEALKAASFMGVADIADLTGLTASEIGNFYRLFGDTERVVTVYSQGINQSSSGTHKVNAIINCHLATGRIGRPGMGPFSVTGQPNAMGGRETGGLANMLAAHMELGQSEHRRIVQRFWQAPRIADAPGLKAVDLFRAVGDGRIKALWIMGTNPVDSMPEADGVRAALEACPFVVVSDVVRHTDTTAFAHVLLPAAAWGEKDGTVTNSERCISRQRPFLPLPGEARPDWWQLAQLARRLGFGAAFDYKHPAEIFAEYARLTAADNGGRRDLDIGDHGAISRAQYDALTPFQWPQPAGKAAAETRFFAEGGFFTPDRRARLVATPYCAPVQPTTMRFPLILNTGRIRDQWHTMTRTAKAPRLMGHAAEPLLEMHPRDAAAAELEPSTIAEIENEHGRALLRVHVTEQQRPGSVFVPMHWTGQLASRARINALVGAATDPVSGQPELKHTAVAVRAFPAQWYAFATMRAKPVLELAGYVVAAPVAAGFRVELADVVSPASWDQFARDLFGMPLAKAELLTYHDASAGQHRFAAFLHGHVVGTLYVARRPLTIARAWVAGQLGLAIPPAHRLRLLAGWPGGATRDRGPLVCACFEVGRNEILDAVAREGATTLAAIGACLKAGTNCGSCRPEISKLLDQACLEKAG
jgi:assimilatory nitrate reductase catalytic subunit